MKKIFADFNARTESGHVRLGCVGSQEDLQDQGVEVGDWMWLSDGELVVGAQLAIDDRYGIVGVPRWNTLVHLDDDDLQEISVVWDRFLRLPKQVGQDLDTETSVFQLLTILETITPQEVRASLPPGYFPLRRAGALHFLGEPDLALIELEDALRARPGDPEVGFFYLETLRKVDPDRAAIEADRRAAAEEVHASVLAACINIRAAAADQVSDEEFGAFGRQILDWIDRFERAPGRDQVRALILAQVQFNRGLAFLRLGRLQDAREALDLAHATNPGESAIDEAIRLEVFDHRARQIAAEMREKAPLVAA